MLTSRRCRVLNLNKNIKQTWFFHLNSSLRDMYGSAPLVGLGWRGGGSYLRKVSMGNINFMYCWKRYSHQLDSAAEGFVDQLVRQ